jgi:hypothetical protein
LRPALSVQFAFFTACRGRTRGFEQSATGGKNSGQISRFANLQVQAKIASLEKL